MAAKCYTKKMFLIITVLSLLALPALTGAAEVMQTAYTPEELAKVREWEKTWAGKKIDKSNIDQVAAFMPESYVGIYKNPKKWGAPAEGFWFTIKPYEFVSESDGFVAATKKYASTVKTNPDGTIANITEIAGRPYPTPKDGMQMAYNFELNNHGDTFKYRKYTPNINPKTKTERMADQEYIELYFINRTEVEPMPALPKNPKGYRRGMFLHMYLPAEFLNTRMYTLRYIDYSKDDDSYLWYSQFRRIRRMSTAQRTDSIDGSDLIYDDEYLWDGQLTRNNYTFKGKKDILCDRNGGLKGTTRESGQAVLNGYTFERCNTLVLDVINKDPNYLYGKRVWYLDPETYLILWTEIYDQQGRFWKCFFNSTAPIKSEVGQVKPVIVGTTFQDFQRTHSGLSDSQRIKDLRVSLPVKSNIFTIANLQKTY